MIQNMFGYDINLFLEQLGNDPRITRFAALPKSTQKLRFLKFGSYVMKDLLFHLNGSLAELTEALAKSNHPYPILKQSALVKDDDGVFSPERMALLLKKVPFPFNLITSYEAAAAHLEFPSIEAFYSDLYAEHISPEKYAEAKEVYTQLGCESLLDMLEKYVTLDTLQLAEITFDYCMKMMSWLRVWPTRFLSIPSLAYATFIRDAGVELELLENEEDWDLFKKNLCGGVAYIQARYCKVEPGSKKSIIMLDATR